MIVKRFGVDFHSPGGALTLPPEAVDKNDSQGGVHTRTHKSGWSILGEIKEDYYTWVNEFEAHHPVYGKVWGDFEDEVYADSEEGFADFYKNHPPSAWDYQEI